MSEQSLRHFLKLARRGKPHTGASSGELQARCLALAIIENACGLDEQAIEGAVDFLKGAAISPAQARDLMDLHWNSEE